MSPTPLWALNQIQKAKAENATELYLFAYQDPNLTEIPPELFELTQLEKLSLREANLKILPLSIKELPALQEIDLRGNPLEQIADVPGLILDFETWQRLGAGLCPAHITGLRLNLKVGAALPAPLFTLPALVRLDLRGNQLSQLPPEIDQLTNLQSLDLSGNQLSHLPPEIGQLTNLQSLDLSDTQLSHLPPEIVQLTNLQSLDLSGNQLSQLPDVVYKLRSLERLELGHSWRDKDNANQITELSPDILRLEKLRQLNVFGQPLQIPPPEVVDMDENGQADIAKIRSYFEQLVREGVDYLYEAKLLIVGEGGAGKTSLARKLENPACKLPKQEASTLGIDVVNFKLNWTCEAVPHFQGFAPPVAPPHFAVNIWDFGGQDVYHVTHQFFLSKRSLYILVADERKEDTDFYYWLNIIEMLGGNSPILIVKNKKQDRDRQINETALRGRFGNLKEILGTNLATDYSLSHIISEIKHQISQLPHIGIPLPKSWVRIRQALKEDTRNHISLQEFEAICEANGLNNDYFKENLGEFLHDLGICLHFKDNLRLRNMVIIKPTWATTAVYRVLDDKQVRNNLGQFDEQDLIRIWHEPQYSEKQAQLLELMQKFGLCYELEDRRGHYIAPELLSKNEPTYNWDEAQNLILRYTYDFMPKGIIIRLIVALNHHIDGELVWKNGVILAKDGTRAEVIEHYTQSPKITVRVVGHNKRGLLEIIMDSLDSIHASFERLQVDT